MRSVFPAPNERVTAVDGVPVPEGASFYRFSNSGQLEWFDASQQSLSSLSSSGIGLSDAVSSGVINPAVADASTSPSVVPGTTDNQGSAPKPLVLKMDFTGGGLASLCVGTLVQRSERGDGTCDLDFLTAGHCTDARGASLQSVVIDRLGTVPANALTIRRAPGFDSATVSTRASCSVFSGGDVARLASRLPHIGEKIFAAKRDGREVSGIVQADQYVGGNWKALSPDSEQANFVYGSDSGAPVWNEAGELLAPLKGGSKKFDPSDPIGSKDFSFTPLALNWLSTTLGAARSSGTVARAAVGGRTPSAFQFIASSSPASVVHGLQVPATSSPRTPEVQGFSSFGSIDLPAPRTSGQQASITASDWKRLQREHAVLHAKPQLAPALASSAEGASASPDALSAIGKCIGCHTDSGRRLVMSEDPKKALAGLREILESKGSGISMFKVTEMMKSSVFAALSEKEEKALVAFLVRGDETASLDSLYAMAKEKYIGETRIPVHQDLPPATVAHMRSVLPKTNNPILDAIFKDTATQFYNDATHPKVYQDGGSQDVSGMHYQSSSILQDWEIPDGRGGKMKMFPNGKFVGPLGQGFGLSGGTDNFKFIWRPKVNGETVPDVMERLSYKDGENNSERGVLFDTQLPTGSIVGEVVMEKGVVKDIRLREILPGFQTAATAFRAFPTAESMSARIKALWPDSWRQDANLSRMVAHLENPSTLAKAESLKDPYYIKVIDQEAWRDNLPPLTDAQEARLRETATFDSALNQEWKRSGEKVAFAPTGAANSHTAPTFDAHAVAVNSRSCARCHEFTMTNFGMLFPAATNTQTGGGNPQHYGMSYGNRQNIFSFNPFPAQYQSFAEGDNRFNADGSVKIRAGEKIVVKDKLPEAFAAYFNRRTRRVPGDTENQLALRP